MAGAGAGAGGARPVRGSSGDSENGPDQQKQDLGPPWSFARGYMLLCQQQASGYPSDLNHTLRWSFYFTPDLRKTNSSPQTASGEE